ncbi:hypothetical protein [Micromonospora sp. LOL_024]|uniref:hypothetical protein n=1 Tax=Micromonospora sp. LOL_024 TaxID=3345412 RepID=UPI003A86FF12
MTNEAESGGDEVLPAFRPARKPRPIFAGTAAHRFPELRAPRAHLDRLRVHHLDLVRRVLEVDGGKVYLPDLLVMSMMQRSYGLVEAVVDCVDGYNLAAAAPLLRMQLDTLVRACYVAHVPLADDVVTAMLKGTEFRRMKDADGKPLTDARLIELAAPHHPWLPPVYKETSGWVHLSLNHLRATWQITGDQISSGVPLRPDVIPGKLWLELLEAMTTATEQLFGYVEMWESRKGLPLGQARGWPDAEPEPSARYRS